MKSNASLARYSDPGNLAKAYLSLEQQLGKKGTVLPTEKSTPEEWNQFYEKLGRPALDKYEIKKPEGKELPNEEFIGKFKEQAFKVGLLPKQAQELLEWSLTESEATMQTQIQGIRAEGEKQLKELKTEWGKDYEENLQKAKSAVDLVGNEFKQYLESTGLGNDVRLIRALSRLGAVANREHQFSGGEGGAGNGQINVDNEIAQIYADPAFMSTEHSAKKDQLNKRLAELQQQKYSA